MAQKRVIILFNIKPGAEPAIADSLKKMIIEEFIPAEKEAPGLLSIELVERFSEPIPHQPDNRASDFALVELWEDAEDNHRWWAGNMFAPKSDRLKKVMQDFKAFMESPAGEYVEFLDCHYTVIA
ncbi:antibiotic biosynthesis monooxygenase [bacterium]|nr:antibiotic biosynthesis monooxygenase [bacterium]